MHLVEAPQELGRLVRRLREAKVQLGHLRARHLVGRGNPGRARGGSEDRVRARVCVCVARGGGRANEVMLEGGGRDGWWEARCDVVKAPKYTGEETVGRALGQ